MEIKTPNDKLEKRSIEGFMKNAREKLYCKINSKESAYLVYERCCPTRTKLNARQFVIGNF